MECFYLYQGLVWVVRRKFHLEADGSAKSSRLQRQTVEGSSFVDDRQHQDSPCWETGSRPCYARGEESAAVWVYELSRSDGGHVCTDGAPDADLVIKTK
ncbi:hypothetical protein Dimus_005447 [Dionaea muscipula]